MVCFPAPAGQTGLQTSACTTGGCEAKGLGTDEGRRWRKWEKENEKGNRGNCEWEDGAGGVGWGNGERGEAAGASRAPSWWGCGAPGQPALRAPRRCAPTDTERCQRAAPTARERDKQVKSGRQEVPVTGTTPRHTQE